METAPPMYNHIAFYSIYVQVHWPPLTYHEQKKRIERQKFDVIIIYLGYKWQILENLSKNEAANILGCSMEGTPRLSYSIDQA